MEYFHQDLFLKFLAALLAVLNPLYGIPIFLSMTRGYSASERRRVAIIVTLTVFVMALIVMLIGEEILGAFGIDVPSFQIAGGLIILGIGFAMLRADDLSAGDAKASAEGHIEKREIAVVPLAIPLISGPGVVVTVIAFAHQMDDLSEVVTMTPPILVATLLIGLGLYFAEPISKRLGNTVLSVVTRIMAIILVAIAVELVAQGALAVVDRHYPGLGGGTAAVSQ